MWLFSEKKSCYGFQDLAQNKQIAYNFFKIDILIYYGLVALQFIYVADVAEFAKLY